MQKIFIRTLLYLGYCIPFVFLAMNEDATSGGLWFYVMLILGFGILCYVSTKTKNTDIVIFGNVLSFISTCIFAYFFKTEKWQYYFKPFTHNQLIIIETVIAFVIQILFVLYFAKKNQTNKINQ